MRWWAAILVGALLLVTGCAKQPPPATDAVALLDSSFTLKATECETCGGDCPPTARTIVTRLRAGEAVAGGFGVAALEATNLSVTDVAVSSRGPLTAGDPLVVTVSGNVIDCELEIDVNFSVCASPPARPTDDCRSPS